MTAHMHGVRRATALLPAIMLITAPAMAQHAPATVSRAAARQVLGTRFPPGTGSGLPDKCGLPFLSSAIGARASLAAGELSALSSILQRVERQTSVTGDGGRFRFHFDTTGSDAPALLDGNGNRIAGTALAFVDSAISIMTNVYQYETGILGFAPPPTDGPLGGGPEYDIYIYDLSAVYGLGTYGLTNPDELTANGGTSSTFIEIHNDFSFVSPAANRGIPSLRVTLAHEFHHAIQIGSYGFWTSDVWFHEITSTWMEDVVYHGENDYLNYLFAPDGQFRQPGLPLTWSPLGSTTMYSRGILGKYFAKRFGLNTMLHIWQNMRPAAPLQAIDLTLRQLPAPTTLPVAFAEWALWNYYTGPRADTVRYYNEAALFPQIAESYYDLISPSQQVTGSLFCLAAAYTGYAAGADTVTVALVNVNAACPAGAQASSPYTLTVSRTKPDDSYRAIAGGLFERLDVTNQSQWVTWSIAGQGPIGNSVTEGRAFPDPYRPGDGGLLFMPAEADGGTLAVYSSGMELVYAASIPTQQRLGQRVFTWNGMTKGNSPAPTGVYVFVLTLGDRTVTGKFALVRR